MYNILSKDEKRARVGETEIVERQGRAGMGKLSKRVRTCDRKSLENFVNKICYQCKLHLQGKKGEQHPPCVYK